MALDGAMLSLIKNEISQKCVGAKVEKIYQPSREEIILSLKERGINERLLLSCRANSPRIHLTRFSVENPAAPPMFCMLLRKKLSGARLSAVRQQGLERVVMLDFDTYNELGDRSLITIVAEIMGKHSNIILTENGKVIDSIKRVDDEMSSLRMVLPGLFYQEVPPQDKLNFLSADSAEAVKAIAAHPELPLSNAVMSAVMGISPIVAREIADSVTDGMDTIVSAMTAAQNSALEAWFDRLKLILGGGGTPCLVYDKSGKPRDFSFFEIKQYGEAMTVRTADTYFEMLDIYYSERDLIERMRSKGADLNKTVTNALSRARRKYANWQKELSQSEKRGTLKLYGDLITANMYAIEKGSSKAALTNYYSSECEEVEVRLDPLLTPAQNAQKYYKDYRKLQSAERHLNEMLREGEREIEYLEAVADSLYRARTERELGEIRAEITEQGYIRSKSKGKQKAPAALPPIKFMSSDGFTILVGRNNKQNDRLTLKESEKDDLWLHVLKLAGSHTIIKHGGREIPESTIEQAAVLAAYHSKARQSGNVAVDFTKVRYVSKPSGAKPGMVIYTHQTTIYVKPDEELVAKLAAD
ncbi:MAG: NFACT family protein [Oscillospiraceae bacterium]|jgi:predicted ribosome quality control (RQC) complex YloA/Tae2 family protein|nr:NFACT family protein [Oscillospiraceae bacterium]